MKANYTFEAESRDQSGKGAARALRRDQKVPAVIYSNGRANVSVTLTEKDITREYKKGGFLNKLVAIKVNGKDIFAVPKDMQFHPVTDRIEHVDFLQVEKDSVVKVKVPVKVIGTDKSMGIKRGGTLNIVRHEIELFCQPENIPSAVTVDIAKANIGDSIHIDTIALPEGVKPVIQRNFTLVTLTGRGGKDEEAKDGAAA
jgi:large subunit ribosomal protein L25